MLFINYSRMSHNTDFPTPDSLSTMRVDQGVVLWGEWRLLEGKRLYNVQVDPHHSTNVIDEHLGMAKRLVRAEEAWWSEVAPIANAAQEIVVGSEHENPTRLAATEWWDVFVDQRRQLRLGARRNSYRDLKLDRPGRYSFALRRWPAESGLAIRANAPVRAFDDGQPKEGVALPVRKAAMMIDRVRQEVEVAESDQEARFIYKLESGPKLLHTWFVDEHDQPITGAYFVRVERLGETWAEQTDLIPTYSADATEAAFLLGGIGTGSISIGARGELRDWELFNKPAKRFTPSYGVFSVWASVPGGLSRALVLEAQRRPPLRPPAYPGSATPQCPQTTRL